MATSLENILKEVFKMLRTLMEYNSKGTKQFKRWMHSNNWGKCLINSGHKSMD